MSAFEMVIHLVLWPFNAAIYTYNVLALATGSEPSTNFIVAAGVMTLLLSFALTLRRAFS